MTNPRNNHPNGDLAAGYIRLSMLPVTYDPFSLDDQRGMIRRAAQRDGKILVREYSDIHVSAANKKVRRPEFESVVEALLRREFQTLYVAKMDRLSRLGVAHVSLLLDQVEDVGGRLVFIADGLDSWWPESRQLMATLAEQARVEVAAIRWRLKQWHAFNRATGRWVHGRQFGLEVVNYKLAPHPIEGPIARQMVSDFLAGASYRGIAAKLNEMGVPAPRVTLAAEARAKGRRAKVPTTERWGYATVRRMLASPALAATALYRGRPVIDENGTPVSFGEGVITFAEHRRLLDEMARRTAAARESRSIRRNQSPRESSTKYLLTGFAKCGICGRRMSVGRKLEGGRESWEYKCAHKIRGYACQGARVRGSTLESEVFKQFAERLADLKPTDSLLVAIGQRWTSDTVPDQSVERRSLKEALGEIDVRASHLYAERYERHSVGSARDLAIWEHAVERLREQRAAITARLAELGPPPGLDMSYVGDAISSQDEWERRSLRQRRELLRLAVTAVFVYPSERNRAKRRVDDRIRIAWTVDDDEVAVRRQGLDNLGWEVPRRSGRA
jgi:site-specific DNA recombinase